jgi:hypothetical protein
VCARRRDRLQPARAHWHFPEGRSQIVTAVALVGFDGLAAEMSVPGSALAQDANGADRVRAVVTTYLDFAERHPATYEAMFRLPIGAPFAAADTPRSMRDGFDAIVGALPALDRPGRPRNGRRGAVEGDARRRDAATGGPLQSGAPRAPRR